MKLKASLKLTVNPVHENVKKCCLAQNDKTKEWEVV